MTLHRAVTQRTQNLHLLNGWPYKDRFRRRVGRKEGRQQWQEHWRLGWVSCHWTGNRGSRGSWL